MKQQDKEKLIINMLCDIYEHLGIEDSFDPKFIRESINTDNDWALYWEYDGLFNGVDDTPDDVMEVVNILDMCDLLEVSIENLKKSERNKISHIQDNGLIFNGFCGNQEFDQIQAAKLLINERRFSRFVGRDLNAHMPRLDAYRRMLKAYKKATKDGHDNMTVDVIQSILDEQVHPSNR